MQRRALMVRQIVWTDVVNSTPRYKSQLEKNPYLNRSIVLKAPGANGEKGVLLLTFEYNWARLLLGFSDAQFQWLDQFFNLLYSTSWSSTDYAVLALALSRTQASIFVQSCNYHEIATFEHFHPRLKCLPTLPCDWVNADLYHPKTFSERTTDILMVANWAEFKRHWALFEALTKMPEHLNVVLIGQPEGTRNLATIQALAKRFGVKQKLQFLESIPIEEVSRQQCNAKVSVIMTRREGCCVAAVESLFAGCALAMREDAHIGPLAYINAETGARLRAGKEAEDLMSLLNRCNTLNPRAWAVKHISGIVSMHKVNERLAQVAIAEGRPWTVDIVLPQWRPHPTFANAHDQAHMRPAYESLIQLAPNTFNIELLTESWR